MRSTSYGFEIARKGLHVNQANLEVTAHNIANANTKGYSRQQVIQKAFSEVDDSLIAVSKLRSQLKDEQAQVNALQRYLDLATLRYQNGYSDYLTVVDAERNLYTAQLQYVQDQGTLYTALINLYAALGGGWVNQAEQMTAPSVKSTTPAG